MTQTPADSGSAPDPPPPPPLPPLPPLPALGATGARKSAQTPAWFLILFTVFWCGITGVFVGTLAVAVVRHLDAQRRFLTTEGVILASEVDSHSDSDGATYGAAVRYRYAVGGREYTGDRHDFGGWRSSAHNYWRGVAAQHPAGARATVYYDPDDPAVSALAMEIPPTMYFQALFLQPFVLMGVGLVVGLVYTTMRERRIRRFLREPVRVPCRIPTWGELREEAGALTVARQRALIFPLLGFATGYGVACFLSEFVLEAGFGDLGTADPVAIKAALAIAVAIGLGAMVLTARRGRGKAEFRAETPTGALTLKGATRNVEVRMADVDAWAVRPVLYPTNQGDPITPVPLLVAVTRAGEDVPVHVFGAHRDAFALADHVARGLGELTGRPFQPDVEAPGAGGGGTGTAAARAKPDLRTLVDAVRQVAARTRSARKAAGQYADLT